MSHSAGAATGTVALGVLSLIAWTLIITSVKYVTLAMRITNDGEGGILALMSLLGIFLSRSDEGVPAVMAWHVRHNGALHQHLLVVNVVNESVPWVADSQRLQLATAQASELALADATYYIGYLEVVPGESHQGPPRWQKGLFAFMARNSLHTADVLQLPKDNVVLIGRQVPV